MNGVINMVLGGAMLFGGLTGKAVLIGTDSSMALAVVGGIVAGLGLKQFVSKRAG